MELPLGSSDSGPAAPAQPTTMGGEGVPAIVYCATNLVNGKRYVGITKRSLRVRVQNHAREAIRDGKSRPFCRAVLKYGIDMFRFRVLLRVVDIEEAKRQEQRLIALLRPEYNATTGGDGVTGYRHSEETRRRLSALKKGKRHGRRPPPENTARLIEARRRQVAAGKPGPWRGKKMPPETIAKIVATRRAKGILEILGRMTSKPVICLDDGKEFPSTSAAGAFYGLDRKVVARACMGGWSRKGLRFAWGRPEDRKHAEKQPKRMSREEMTEMLRRRARAFRTMKRNYSDAEIQRRREQGAKTGKPVVRLNDGKTFASAAAAAREIGVTGNAVAQVCRGVSQTVLGFRFRYEVSDAI